MRFPTPEEIQRARDRARHSQAQAAAVVCVARRTWQDWERGIARMNPALLEYYKLMTRQHETLLVAPK